MTDYWQVRCLHAQAVEVRTLLGELVACLCVGCYEQLPPGYIGAQLDRAWAAATCTHPSQVSLIDLGQPVPSYICTACGEVSDEDLSLLRARFEQHIQDGPRTVWIKDA